MTGDARAQRPATVRPLNAKRLTPALPARLVTIVLA
jgi:hypothetical protein